MEVAAYLPGAIHAPVLHWKTALGAGRPKRDFSRSNIAWPLRDGPLPACLGQIPFLFEQCLLYKDEAVRLRFGSLGASRFKTRRGVPANCTNSRFRYYGISTVDPLVFRLSSAIWASATARNGNSRSMFTRAMPFFTTSKVSAAAARSSSRAWV
uniref:Uncharacterized protein n=1 Tax=Candidatus Kentrum sp. TC TaxID=2126339 RepID=A0A450YNB8_9GAMM|nr:MAG: hypothetical protein BECKTC1821E_GA0114239_102245 [Candidatus Kentron sp. TC]